jgi:hypothetical protein
VPVPPAVFAGGATMIGFIALRGIRRRRSAL